MSEQTSMLPFWFQWSIYEMLTQFLLNWKIPRFSPSLLYILINWIRHFMKSTEINVPIHRSQTHLLLNDWNNHDDKKLKHSQFSNVLFFFCRKNKKKKTFSRHSFSVVVKAKIKIYPNHKPNYENKSNESQRKQVDAIKIVYISTSSGKKASQKSGDEKRMKNENKFKRQIP